MSNINLTDFYPNLRDVAFFAAGSVATLAGAYGYHQLTKPKELPDQKIRDIFQRLGIQEWHLPGLSSQIDIKTSTDDPRPIFNQRVQDDIDILRQRIIKSRDNGAQPPLPNVILTGIPGVGKTMLLKNLCLETGIGFIRIRSGTGENLIKTGNQNKAMQDIIDIAGLCKSPDGKKKIPVGILMDDGEKLVEERPVEVKKPDNQKDVKASWIKDTISMRDEMTQRRVALVNSILEESGKDERNVGYFISTNRKEVIDKAFLTRCLTIEIDPPGEWERKNIIKEHVASTFKNAPSVIPFFDQRILTLIAKKTENFTGRNLVKMLEDLYATVQMANGDITEELVDAAIVGVQRSLSQQEPNDDSTPDIANRIVGFFNGFLGIFAPKAKA